MGRGRGRGRGKRIDMMLERPRLPWNISAVKTYTE